MSHAVARADRLVAEGKTSEATDVLRQAGGDGDALAARELAVWYLQGHPVPRDLTEARRAFTVAARLDDPPSLAIERAFLAQGIGGAADWPQALRLLEAASATDPAARRQHDLIAAMGLPPGGDPPPGFMVEELCPEPRVALVRGLLTAGECAYLIEAAQPLAQPALVVDPRTGRMSPHPIRTSDTAAFPLIDENPAIHALNRRIAAASGTDVRCGEPLQVLRYAPGQQYRLHSDALPGVPPGQQRVLTCLVWLNDGFAGGETDFPELQLRLRGEPGDALLFASADRAGRPDPRAVHAGLPVVSGTKWLASRWIRAAPLRY